MAFDRRRGGGRPSGPGRGGQRGDRPQFDRPAYDRPPRGDFGDRAPRDRPPGDRPPHDRGGFDPRGRPGGAGGYRPRSADDGGMSIRLDPRRLAALKLLAAEAGVRPGELVTAWVEERLDAARAGAPGDRVDAIGALTKRVDELARRLDALAAAPPSPGGAGVPTPLTAVPMTPDATEEATPDTTLDAAQPEPAPRRRGRPPKAAVAAASGRRRRSARSKTANPRVPLHEEIAAVITERGPMSAADLATAIVERGRYAPPRSAKPLDAATVNSRVSNPTYRARFARNAGRIGLAVE